MPRGRKPKDPDQPLKPGERADRIKAPVAQPVEGVPVAPSHLDKIAVAEFKEIVHDMELSGTLSRSDGHCIALYADSYARWVRANAELKVAGDYMTLPNGIVTQHPAYKTIDKAISQMAHLLKDFGLTPSSRKKVPVLKPKEAEADGWEGLL